jgi:hypothetical protein
MGVNVFAIRGSVVDGGTNARVQIVFGRLPLQERRSNSSEPYSGKLP